MGMYNCIKFEEKCSSCGDLLDGFQSKPWNGDFDILEPWSVDSFYDICFKCNLFIEYTRKSSAFCGTDEWLKDYDREVRACD